MFGRERETVPEFTLKAVVAGIVLGIVFGAANAYLGLKVGMTVTATRARRARFCSRQTA